MQWREIWRLYLTPGDGLLILLLEEFVSKSFSFINDISLFSMRHLLYIQKGNYLFRPGNNISYRQCLNVWSKSNKREKKSEAHSKDYPKQDCIYREVVLVPLHLEMKNYMLFWVSINVELAYSSSDITTQEKLHYFYIFCVWRNSIICEAVKHVWNGLLIWKYFKGRS